MWRAFFFATGFALIILGVESLTFERIQLASGDGLPKFATRMMENASMLSGPGAGPVKPAVIDVGVAPTASAGRAGGRSAFGPSRFADNFSGTNTFSATPYRSSPTEDKNGQVPGMDLASYSTPVATAGSTAAQRRPSGNFVYARDWMPWSLLAVGSIVLLYTRSMTRNN